MYYTLNYINKAGDTIARDYFNHLSEAVELFRQLKHTYRRNGLETALLLTDSNGREIMWYIPEDTHE